MSLLLPLYYIAFQKNLLPIICYAVAIHIVLASDFGTALKVYDAISWWDLFVHGMFGFICTATVFFILSDSEKIELKPIYILIIAFAFSMAFGALWEIFEYGCDLVFGGDTQRIAESVAAGKSPIADTMEDLMITFVGAAVFAVTYLIDKLTSHKAFQKLGLLRKI